MNFVAALLLVCVGACVRTRFLKQLLLLAGSYLFYAAWGTGFLAILAASSVLNFGFGAWLRRQPTLPRVWTGVIGNIALLSFFKYLPALAPGSSSDFIHRIVMPAGMSFWTFQALSYLFDIYREEELDPSLVEFCLYMSFWPTVLMGPVCRLPNLLPQFRKVHGFSFANCVAGLRRIGTGLFMKLILAEFVGSALASASDVTSGWGGLDVWFIAIGFGFQLFFDFAGYSHVVIGAARLFGFAIEENFDAPYLSSTPSVFWTKWHMSLSSWIRDYVFVPTATLRREPWWRYFAVFFSMVLFGLWHGATLTFLLWGIYHGMFLVLHRLGQQYKRRFGVTMDGTFGSVLSWVLTFLGVSLGWVLFRTNDLHQAFSMFHEVLSPASYTRIVLPGDYYRTVLAVMLGYFGYCGLMANNWVRGKLQGLLADESEHPSAVCQLIRFSWENRWWWVTPMIATLVIFAGMAVLVKSTRVTPFIYTLF